MLTHHRIQAVVRLYKREMIKSLHTSQSPELRNNVIVSNNLPNHFKELIYFSLSDISEYILEPFGKKLGIAPQEFELRKNQTPIPKDRFLDRKYSRVKKLSEVKFGYEKRTQSGSTKSAGQNGTEQSAKGSAQAPNDVPPAILKSTQDSEAPRTNTSNPPPEPNSGRGRHISPAPPTPQNRSSAANRASSAPPTVRRRPRE